MSNFQIDFFELSFLAEVCIPPRPIARATFWHDLINKHYNTMTEDERCRLFEWITKNDNFNKENEDCQWFYARFNPNNQYLVSYFHNGKAYTISAFLKDGKYWTSMTRYIAPQYIKSADKITNDNRHERN